MSRIELSAAASADIKRLYEFLAQFDLSVADNSNDTIAAGLAYLALNPTSGTPVEDRPHTRKSVVNFGASGYLIFHRYFEKVDVTFVARIIHQKEWYDAQKMSVGR